MQTPYLSQIPLSTFLRHVTECLPPAKHIYLLVDELEDFLARDPSELASFKQGWLQALTDFPARPLAVQHPSGILPAVKFLSTRNQPI